MQGLGNIKNEDDLCLLYSLICCLEFKHEDVKDKQRVSKYKPYIDKYVNTLSNLKIRMPPDFKDYPKIDAAFGMTINVIKYSIEDKSETLYTY